ncbi:hypothetical protein C9J03_15360 [Photobacterium gaetbulicola]|uniref:Uncharacterized protein n=1 Tax=Photobacterium gaetbulicola Gung47 TaxID=658445 RepID=A0A0C5WQ15_9GAMM|nr:hypothetical protein [Photobacterium gaetbulicola]AJR05045.1 hypothetical protein H744_1c0012 [Photobacterium gaetbulicola Gung47]PSU06924.1 hypothetical protein C9J03_15360 [Photobacterium gaetbulicola]
MKHRLLLSLFLLHLSAPATSSNLVSQFVENAKTADVFNEFSSYAGFDSELLQQHYTMNANLCMAEISPVTLAQLDKCVDGRLPKSLQISPDVWEGWLDIKYLDDNIDSLQQQIDRLLEKESLSAEEERQLIVLEDDLDRLYETIM